MKKSYLIIIIILSSVFSFLLGQRTGRVKEVIVEVEKGAPVKVPFMDLTISEEKRRERINAYANLHGWAVMDIEEYWRKRAALDDRIHTEWLRGYQEGYRLGVESN